MPAYRCLNANRARLVEAHATLNGIDHLEVADEDPPYSHHHPLRQRTLLLHCFKPVAGLTRHHVRILGGVRTPDVAVTWAHPADDVPAGLLTPAEVASLLEPLRDPARVLVIRTDVRGDASEYTLELAEPPGRTTPPKGFDAVLSRVPFSFKVACPSPFDCMHAEECPPEVEDRVPIDYLTRDYASFRRLMLDRLATTMPQWRDRNAADVVVTLVEALAHAADHLSYYQDAVATEAYLGTARRRTSVRRHARLLDYRMHDGCNARAFVALEVDGAADGAILHAVDSVTGRPLAFLTRCPAPVAVPTQALPDLLADHRPEVFEAVEGVTLLTAHNAIRLYTWGDDACCLPQGATRATLVDDELRRLRLVPGDVLVFEERKGPDTGLPEDADPTRRHAVRLTQVSPAATVDPVTRARTPGDLARDPLTGVPIVEIAWDAADALPFPLCVSTRLEGVPVEDVTLAAGNVLLVDQGHTRAGSLEPREVVGDGSYRPILPRRDVTYRVDLAPEEVARLPASRALAQDPGLALPALRLADGLHTWTPRRDLLASDAFDRHLVLETEDDEFPRLRFGDNVHGRSPGAGWRPGVTLRTGNGSAGNVGAGAIAHLVTDLEGLVRVRNPLPASGGVDAEPVERVRLIAPTAFRRQERAVTEADYAEVAARHPDVQRAVATMRWTGSWHTVFITVDRFGGRPVDDAFEAELVAFMDTYRLAGYDVEIEPPRHVPLDIAMSVCVESGASRTAVHRELTRVFSARDLRDGRRGFFHPDNFTFGDSVHLSRIVAAAMAVPGVKWVDLDDAPPKPNRFKRHGEASHGEFRAGVIRMGRVEVARLDNDPNAPENGRIEFRLEGGR